MPRRFIPSTAISVTAISVCFQTGETLRTLRGREEDQPSKCGRQEVNILHRLDGRLGLRYGQVKLAPHVSKEILSVERHAEHDRSDN